MVQPVVGDIIVFVIVPDEVIPSIHRHHLVGVDDMLPHLPIPILLEMEPLVCPVLQITKGPPAAPLWEVLPLKISGNNGDTDLIFQLYVKKDAPKKVYILRSCIVNHCGGIVDAIKIDIRWYNIISMIPPMGEWLFDFCIVPFLNLETKSPVAFLEEERLSYRVLFMGLIELVPFFGWADLKKGTGLLAVDNQQLCSPIFV